MKKLTPQDIFQWSVQRVPTMIVNIDKNNPIVYQDKMPNFDNIYINMSDIIRFMIQSFKFPTTKELILSLKTKLNEILDIIDPSGIVGIFYDGAKPAALFKQEKELLFKLGDYTGNFISLNHLLPCSDGIVEIENEIDNFLQQRLINNQGQEKWQFISNNTSVPGDASLKINEYIKTIRKMNGYNPDTVHCMIDSTTEGFLNCLISHEQRMYNLNLITFNSQQIHCIKCKRSGHYYNMCLGKDDNYFQQVEFINPHFQLYNFQEFRSFLTFEFSYLNFPEYNLERVIDDFVLLVVLQGNLATPKLNFLPLNEGGLDIFLYLYKRVLPHLGFLTENGVIKQIQLSIYFKEFGNNIEDVIIKNYLREEEINRYRNPRAHEAWKIFIKDLKSKLASDYNEDDDEEYEDDDENERKNSNMDNEDDVPKIQLSSEDQVKKILQQTLKETMEQTGKTADELGLKQQEINLIPVNKAEVIKDQDNYCTGPKMRNQQFTAIDQAYQQFEDVQIDFSKYAERFWEGISYNEIYCDPTQQQTSYERWTNSKNEQEKLSKQVGEKDYKQNFYLSKFKIEPSDLSKHIQNIQENYLAAVHWSFAYYFTGYQSWQWQYVYCYAPFYSDITHQYEKMVLTFDLGTVIKALDYQIIMTHPSQSKTLPLVFQHLHTDSEIMDLWPFQYSSDFNWSYTEEVTIIPPFDIERLLEVTSRYEVILEDKDFKKNRIGKMFIYSRNKYLQEYPNQYRQKLNFIKNQIPGEVFICNQSEESKNSLAPKFIYVPPNENKYQCTLVPGVKNDYQPQYCHEVAEILDSVLYINNNLIKQVERILSGSVDQSEQYNKGLIMQNTEIDNAYHQKQIQRPQQPVQKPVYNPPQVNRMPQQPQQHYAYPQQQQQYAPQPQNQHIPQQPVPYQQPVQYQHPQQYQNQTPYYQQRRY